MPIVEAVAQQIISAEAEAEATQMTNFQGASNPGLEIDGIMCSCSHSGVQSFGH